MSKHDAMMKGADCLNCPLYEKGKYVPSSGPARAEIAFVGEAGGQQEALIGRPFIGKSGKLLDQVISHYGYKREEALYTNAVLCRPPENAKPPTGAITACRPRLVQELKERGTEVAVALGNSAAKGLLGQEGITKLRVGQAKDSPYWDGKVIPSFHPAACLRPTGQSSFPHLVTDIGKIKYATDASQPPPLWDRVEYRATDNEYTALAFMSEIDRHKGPVVFDIETGLEKDNSFDHPNNYELLCIGFSLDSRSALVIGKQALKYISVRHMLIDVLSKKDVIAHNGKFDLAGLYPLFKDRTPRLFFDTMIASYVLDERSGIHGLEYLSIEYLNAPSWKKMIQGTHAETELETLYEYNAYDCAATYRLYEMFARRLEGESLRGLHDFLCSAAQQLMYLELNGIAIDLNVNRELTERYKEIIGEVEGRLERIIEKAIGDKEYDKKAVFNPRSPKQVKEVLSDLGIQAPKTDETVLKEVCDKTVPDSYSFDFASTLLEHRRQQKIFGTYVKGITKRTYQGRIYPTFMLHSTTTGRLSCRNPNLQNVVRDKYIKAQFVPSKPGHSFINMDYKQAELRVLTWLAQEEYFRDVFVNGRDLFNELMPRLYGDTSRLSPERQKDLRVRVKAYVYGLSYGREAASIAAEHKLSLADAQRGMDAFFEVIPNVVAFQKRIRHQVLNEDKDLISPFGRHRRFWLITQENKKDIMNEALAFLPQSTASDICLSAAIRLRQDLKGIGYIRNIVHDSVLVETHDDYVEEVSRHMKQVAIEEGNKLVDNYVPFDVDVDVGKSWGEV